VWRLHLTFVPYVEKINSTSLEILPLPQGIDDNNYFVCMHEVFARRQYIALTQDVDWLTSVQDGNAYTGNEFIQEMAAFWESRPTLNDATGQWNINSNHSTKLMQPHVNNLTDVMPPDEHQEDVDNSIYTNFVANYAVNTARWTTCLAEGESAARAAIPDEWLEKMENLVYTYNADKRYHEEYQGFDNEITSGKASKFIFIDVKQNV